MTYVSIVNTTFDEMNEIIRWYLTSFVYHRITTFYTEGTWGKGYHTLTKNDILSISNYKQTPSLLMDSGCHLRFLFKHIEDKTLFELTWK